jgi:hypothetical protein
VFDEPLVCSAWEGASSSFASTQSHVNVGEKAALNRDLDSREKLSQIAPGRLRRGFPAALERSTVSGLGVKIVPQHHHPTDWKQW